MCRDIAWEALATAYFALRNLRLRRALVDRIDEGDADKRQSEGTPQSKPMALPAPLGRGAEGAVSVGE